MTPKRVLKWILTNGLMAALLWYGFGPDQVDGARYLYTFSLGVVVFMLTVIVLNDELLKTARENPRPVPAWLCISYDLFTIAFLVWMGHWFLGVLIVWEVICLANVYNLETKEGAPA